MGIGTSIFLIAVGAILDFAVKEQVNGIDVQAIGVILMIVGGIGLLASFVIWHRPSSLGWSRRTTVVDGDLPATRDLSATRTVVRDQEFSQ